MNKTLALFLLALALSGCRSSNHSEAIVSMQILDRNGFSETISSKERLDNYQRVDFLSSQPYEKVLRVYGKDGEGKSHSKITSYYETGGPFQYLEALDGRANGKYLQWHENGTVRIEGKVIDGLADFSTMAMQSWLFDGPCTVWDERGNCEAKFFYDKGHLVQNATFYYPDGTIQRIIPYFKGEIEGTVQEFDEEGRILKAISFRNGKKEGKAHAKWNPELFQYQELYKEGLLLFGTYFDQNGEKVAEVEHGEGTKAHFEQGRICRLSEYRGGSEEGTVKLFDEKGNMHITYLLENGMKTGDEWEYYPPKGEEARPKLLIPWYEDQIQGMVKTWYENGRLESQKEMSGNKKHGISFAYYRSGDLMLMEEYENDKLLQGSYFKKGEKHPVSTIESGEGTATLYNAEGHFMKKVAYERGKPLVE